MSLSLFRKSAPWSVCLCLLLALAVPQALRGQSVSSNTAATFPPLAELLRKWGDVPLDGARRAAETGDPAAQHYLGHCYAEGVRVSSDPALAVGWYERSGKAGYLPSWNALGLLYQRGRGVPKELSKAFEYYRRAAEAGLPRAQANLGFLYKDGLGVSRDPAAAMRWFRVAADNGLTTGMVEVGRLFRFGQGVVADSDTAAAWFRKAADKGDPLGEYNLGLLDEAEGNLPRAIPLFRRAAEAGRLEAMVSLYFVYVRGSDGPSNMTEAMKWLNQSAQGGNAYAQCLLGYRYENPVWDHSPGGDRLPPPNMPEAVRWYRRSAEQNWAGAQYHLGLCYLAGTGVEQDEEFGLELIRKAADQSHVYAMVELAQRYARGVGAPRSETDHPLRILQRVVASKPGNDDSSQIAEAYEALLLRYEHGIGTERDVVAAVECHCRAALAGIGQFSLANPEAPEGRPAGTSYTGDPERPIIAVTLPDSPRRSEDFLAMLELYLKAARGDARAPMQIANACLEGADTPKSPRRAWLWLSLAARNGSPNAQTALSGCQSHMSDEELKTAKQELPDFLQRLGEIGRQARLQSQLQR